MISDASGALQTIKASCDFLRQYSPYADIPESLLIKALDRACLSYHPAGETLFSPQDGLPKHFSIVQQGLITGRRSEEDADSAVFECGPGETFLNVALLENRPTKTYHIAEHDSFIIEIPKKGFGLLLRESDAFRDFCERRASTFIDSVRQRIRSEAATALQTDLSLDTPLADLIQKSPVSCPSTTAVKQAVHHMHDAEVGSIVITDGDNRPTGIFTLRDLRAMIAGSEHDLGTPIEKVMSGNPVTLTADEPAYEATLKMIQHHIGHVIIVDDGRLRGVVSERDLFALKRVNMVQLARNIEHADSAAELRAIRESVILLIRTMLAAGASARQLTGIITRLNDAMVQRVINLCREQWHEPVPDFTWLSFGSEARAEQTLATDQDNGILFETNDMNADQARTLLLPLARHINQTLDQVGFPLCRGNIMAGNGELCLSAREWRDKYHDIIHSASPEKLLYATIFLDLRPLYGEAGPVHGLQEGILQEAANNTIFLHALAQDALSQRPPIGMFRTFVTQRGDDGKTLDLKTSGLQPFIGGIRVLALANEVKATNTEDRIDALRDLDVIQPHNAAAWKEAFSFIQLLRLRRNQGQMEAGQALSNDIDPYALNPLDKRILKEALRQAQRLQARLKLDYT